MIWYKSWLETRPRLILCVALVVLMCLSYFVNTPSMLERLRTRPRQLAEFAGLLDPVRTAWVHDYLRLMAIVLPIAAITLAGAGINTQTAHGTTMGIHGSMLFTLSLPVSRRRLLLVRAALGQIGFVVLAAIPFLVLPVVAPRFTQSFTAADLGLMYLAMVSGCTVFYALAVLLATWMDEFWHGMTMLFSTMALFGLLGTGLIPSLNVFSFMSGTTYLRTGQFSWLAVAACMVLSTLLTVAALRLVERKEY